MELFDWTSAFTSILVFIITGVLTLLVKQLKDMRRAIETREHEEFERRRKHDTAVDEGLRAVLRSSITDAYERYVQQGELLSVERKRVIELEHDAYRNLGGNDVGDQMYEEILTVPTVIIGRDVL